MLDLSNEGTFALAEPPKNTALPVISPETPIQGSSTSTSNGTWSGSPTSYAYQWQRCNAAGGECANITGATKATYTPVKADIGKALVSKVTAGTSGGLVSAVSKASGAVVLGWTLTPVPPLSENYNTSLRGVSCPVSTSVCTAVGGYLNLTYKPLAERWNGSEWSQQTMPAPSGSGSNHIALNDVSCPSASLCEAVGFYKPNSTGVSRVLVEVWNGTEWKLQTMPEPAGAQESVLEDVSCTSSTACTAVGYYKNSSGVIVSLAERWSGTEWAIQTTPNPTGAKETKAIGVSCASATACTMTGYYMNSSGVMGPFAESWNGTTWTTQTVPAPSGAKGAFFGGVSCTSATACTSVGAYVTGGVPAFAPFAERWNGTEWKIQTLAAPGGGGTAAVSDVSCVSATVCTAVGNYTPSISSNTLAERWNGTEWSIQSTPNGEFGGLLESVSCASTVLCAAVGNSGGIALAEVYG